MDEDFNGSLDRWIAKVNTPPFQKCLPVICPDVFELASLFWVVQGQPQFWATCELVKELRTIDEGTLVSCWGAGPSFL